MKEGFDRDFGAREMERVVERRLAQPLGKALLEGRFPDGSAVVVDARDGELAFKAAERTNPAWS